SHVAALARAALIGYASSRGRLAGPTAVRAAEWEMARRKSVSSAELKRRLSLLATIATTAPLVGLLGTVFGILDSTRGIGMSHATAVSMMAGTLAESLITTALGMLVAVPTVWSYNYLSEGAELMTIEMEMAISELKRIW
ncbi:MAG TPA: MotA/TolQ/ExbB proton channel family protein, partial [Candidatus Acidoferrum sp.]|nr:MotA/TolQ/ExbB proton channel family protein [Candidatus Acidoferrum sp.]